MIGLGNVAIHVQSHWVFTKEAVIAINMASIVATPFPLQEPQAVRFQLATSVSKTAEIYASLG